LSFKVMLYLDSGKRCEVIEIREKTLIVIIIVIGVISFIASIVAAVMVHG